MSAGEVDHWAVSSAGQNARSSTARSDAQSAPKAPPAVQAKKRLAQPAPAGTPGFSGAFIVVLSIVMTCAVGMWARSARESALVASCYMCFGNATMCLLCNWIFSEYSWTDRLWSVTPFFYTLYFAWDAQWDQRLSIMATLTALWSLRLSYNFARKGGYVIGEQVLTHTRMHWQLGQSYREGAGEGGRERGKMRPHTHAHHDWTTAGLG